jgi:hypothetical protein
MRPTSAQLCRDNGWTVGTHLAGDEGYGVTVITLTAIGEQNVLARQISHAGKPYAGRESSWTLAYRDWRKVDRA